MSFWILTAAGAAIVTLAMALAVLRGARRGLRGEEAEASADDGTDQQIYRDQLAEIARDLERGVIGAEEAERARIEVSRRLLEAARRGPARLGAAPRGANLALAVVGVAALGGVFALYSRMGAPDFPDQPMAARLDLAEMLYTNRPDQAAAEAEAAAMRPAAPEPDAEFAALMERLRAAVAERPNDPEGLALLARNEASLGDYHAAWQAMRRLVAIKGDQATAEDYAQMAELMVVAAGGVVTPEAEAELRHALERDPANQSARYFMGLLMVQNGRPDRAFPVWARLLDEGPEEAPWIRSIRTGIRDLAWLAGETDYTPPPVRQTGPSRADLDRVASLPPEARGQALGPALQALGAKLANTGGTAEDWARLLAGMLILGEEDRARAMWDEAQGVFAERPEDLARIRAEALRGGLEAPRDGEAVPPPFGARALPGPDAAAVEAAGEMSEADRQAMIAGMVEGLEARLMRDGGSPAEWARLMRALGVLGDGDRARAALARAAETLDPAALAELRAAGAAAGFELGDGASAGGASGGTVSGGGAQ
ncbi:c-type cytochrome biogenesis protein CcmI [Phaeovulum vinaykumarii]|uniref:Cytochrome c-type biogenesis protein CcmH n=1 Tax=Phaeovulum vinaykumarii TaxID=407234 RepID=A0A1N7JQS4_9RHOB|nr:c-type cytochrome biogenesis protein CcmI [Phaeovulum vinaykumarii]SIS51657.1 cytochrome c-type biogenesis protein CcmH [Phaeovulum vinaykumarii]SOB90861.1 cytochrome c-type biogenesis protein CcmH [Phaeovulum vinaykumarii]